MFCLVVVDDTLFVLRLVFADSFQTKKRRKRRRSILALIIASTIQSHAYSSTSVAISVGCYLVCAQDDEEKAASAATPSHAAPGITVPCFSV